MVRQLKDRLAAGAGWEETELVFTTPLGTALDPRNVSREFHVLLNAAKLPAIWFSRSAAHHRHAPARARRGPAHHHGDAGHSTINLTLNTYAHVLPAL